MIYSETQSCCNGCAECIDCGRRNETYTSYEFECDECHRRESDLELFEGYTGKQLCRGCYTREWLNNNSGEAIADKLEELDMLFDFAIELTEEEEPIKGE